MSDDQEFEEAQDDGDLPIGTDRLDDGTQAHFGQVQLAPSQMAAEVARRMDAERHADAASSGLLPEPEAAAKDVERRRERLAVVEEEVNIARRALDDAEAAADDAKAAVGSAERAVAMAQSTYDLAIEAEREAFEQGAATIDVDVDAARKQVEAAQRRVDVLKAAASTAAEALPPARAAHESALQSLRSAKFHTVRAEAELAMAEAARAFMATVVPALREVERAAGDHGQAVQARAMRRALACEIGMVLPDELAEKLPVASRRMAREQQIAADAKAPAGDLVPMVVRPFNMYGTIPAGSRVMVSPEEAALQSRVDSRSGEPLGALETVAEYEARQAAASAATAEREAVRYKRPSIVQTVEQGLARLYANAKAKREAKDAEEKRARQDRELTQRALQKLIDARSAATE